MARKLALVFKTQDIIEPYSDIEGLINRIPDQLGLSTQSTLVSGDRTTIVIVLKDKKFYPVKGENTVDNSTVEQLEHIVKDNWSKRIRDFDISTVNTDNYYQSASVAKKEHQIN